MDEPTGPNDVARRPALKSGTPRNVSPEELIQILQEHQKWLDSDGKEGTRARLRGCDLRRARLDKKDLTRADLRGAWIGNANFKGAKLLGANLEGVELHGSGRPTFEEADLRAAILRGADLTEANFKNAKLHWAKFQEAFLKDADLSETIGLTSPQLAGADLSGTNLPENVAKFEGLAHVEEMSRNARKIFLAMLLGCAYGWLTIGTTTDVALLTNSPTSPLPIIQTKIPLASFYWVAPIVLLGLYVYFHLYMQRLWVGLASLPAVFPDGKPLNERAYPWLLNGLVSAHFARLKNRRPPLSRLEAGIAILFAWWVVPLTLLLVWGRYLPRHDWNGTWLHITLLAVAIGFGFAFQGLMRVTLRGEERHPFVWRNLFKDARTFKRGAVVIGSALVGVLFYFQSWGAIEGVPPHLYDKNERESRGLMIPPELEEEDFRRLVPSAFARIGYSPFANFRRANVSNKPANWTGEEKDIALVKGADLSGTDLWYADAVYAFLVKANLADANLRRADLHYADLRGAVLTDAKLQKADFGFANLRNADFSHAYAGGARFFKANLQGANFKSTSVEGADFRGAKLYGTNLKEALGLKQSQLDEACVDETTKLPEGLNMNETPCPEEGDGRS